MKDKEMTNFSELMHNFCALVGSPVDRRLEGFAEIEIDDVRFTLVDRAEEHDGCVAYFCDFGPIPSSTRKAEIMQRLLEGNLSMFGIAAPYFTLNHSTGHVLLAGRAPLDSLTAERLLSAFKTYAVQVREWRRNFFLDNPATPNQRSQKTRMFDQHRA